VKSFQNVTHTPAKVVEDGVSGSKSEKHQRASTEAIKGLRQESGRHKEERPQESAASVPTYQHSTTRLEEEEGAEDVDEMVKRYSQRLAGKRDLGSSSKSDKKSGRKIDHFRQVSEHDGRICCDYWLDFVEFCLCCASTPLVTFLFLSHLLRI
jgi:hypothetical protein